MNDVQPNRFRRHIARWLLCAGLCGLPQTVAFAQPTGEISRHSAAITVVEAWKILGVTKTVEKPIEEQAQTRVETLLGDLGSESWPVRDNATRELIAMGKPVIPSMQAATRDSDPEVAWRAKNVIASLTGTKKVVIRVGPKLIQAVNTLARAKDKELIPKLLAMLRDRNPAVRQAAEYGLRRITGKNFGFNAYEMDSRTINLWAAWWKKSKATFTFPELKTQRLFVCDRAGGKLMIYTAEGKLLRTLDVDEEFSCAAIRANGNILVGTVKPGRVVEYDAKDKIVWDTAKLGLKLPSVLDVQADGKGGVYLATPHSGKVQQIDKTGKVVWEVGDLKHPHSLQALEGGNFLIAEHAADRVIEIDAKGKVVWEYNKVEKPADARKMPNGNVLIADFKFGAISEVSHRRKRLLLRIAAGGPLSGVCRLPDGRIAATGNGNGPVLLEAGWPPNRVFGSSKNLWGKIRVVQPPATPEPQAETKPKPPKKNVPAK